MAYIPDRSTPYTATTPNTESATYSNKGAIYGNATPYTTTVETCDNC